MQFRNWLMAAALAAAVLPVAAADTADTSKEPAKAKTAAEKQKPVNPAQDEARRTALPADEAKASKDKGKKKLTVKEQQAMTAGHPEPKTALTPEEAKASKAKPREGASAKEAEESRKKSGGS